MTQMVRSSKPFASRQDFERSLNAASDDQINDICYICYSPQESTIPFDDRCIGPPVLMTCCPVPRVVGKKCLRSWLNSPATGVNNCIACHQLLYHGSFCNRVDKFLNDQDPLDRGAQSTFETGVLASIGSFVVAYAYLSLHWRWSFQNLGLTFCVILWCCVRPLLQTFLGLFLHIPRRSRRRRDDDPVDTIMGVFFPLQAFERGVGRRGSVPVYPKGEDCGFFYPLMMRLRTCGVSKRWVWRKYWTDTIFILQLIDLSVWTALATFGLMVNLIWFTSLVTGVVIWLLQS